MADKNNFSGVYKILNKINGKFYIGSCKRSRARWSWHLKDLRKNKHFNRKLQSSWNKYGEECFEFILIVKCPPEYVVKLEQWFIDNLKPEYNLRPTANSQLGFKHSEETKKRLSDLSFTRSLSKGKIYEYDINGYYVRSWDNITQISEIKNISYNSVAGNLYGNSRSCHGCVFRRKLESKIDVNIKLPIKKKTRNKRKLGYVIQKKDLNGDIISTFTTREDVCNCLKISERTLTRLLTSGRTGRSNYTLVKENLSLI